MEGYATVTSIQSFLHLRLMTAVGKSDYQTLKHTMIKEMLIHFQFCSLWRRNTNVIDIRYNTVAKN